MRQLLKSDVSTTYLVDRQFSKAPQNGRAHAGHNRGAFQWRPYTFANGRWQVQVRRRGYRSRTQSFLNKTDAQRWARHIETELNRTLIPNDVRALAKVTLAELLIRYRDTVTISRRGLLPETKRIEAFLAKIGPPIPSQRSMRVISVRYRDDRLKCVGPGTVIRELGNCELFETARRERDDSSLENPIASLRKPKAPDGRERARTGRINRTECSLRYGPKYVAVARHSFGH